MAFCISVFIGTIHLLRGPAVNISENHVWSLLLHKNILPVEHFGEKALKSSFFLARNGILPANVSKTLLPGQMIISFWRHEITFTAVHFTDDDVRFCESPWMLIPKTTNLCINSAWIALLMRGFMPVKAWLLIVCDITFYAVKKLTACLKCTYSLICNIILFCLLESNFTICYIGLRA